MIVRVIAGPTASGKSALALRMAGEIGGVIINADSMQVYDALPILTARPSADDERQVPHRLYGFLDATERCTAARWAAEARREIDAALTGGENPVVVGGTGFYISALTEGLSPIPDVPPEMRARVSNRQRELGNPVFHAELEKRDPVMAARLNPNDTQRLIRAMEVLEATGRSLSYWQSLPPEKSGDYEFEIHPVMPDRMELNKRCDRRFDMMMAADVLEEVRAFDARITAGEVPEDSLVTHALGFRPLRAHLHGTLSREEAIALSKTETRQYAKRQVTWFRNRMKQQDV